MFLKFVLQAMFFFFFFQTGYPPRTQLQRLILKSCETQMDDKLPLRVCLDGGLGGECLLFFFKLRTL